MTRIASSSSSCPVWSPSRMTIRLAIKTPCFQIVSFLAAARPFAVAAAQQAAVAGQGDVEQPVPEGPGREVPGADVADHFALKARFEPPDAPERVALHKLVRRAPEIVNAAALRLRPADSFPLHEISGHPVALQLVGSA